MFFISPYLSTSYRISFTLFTNDSIFPNVDFCSGIVYHALGILPEFFTPMFAVSRVAGWTARVEEYLKNNRIFRLQAMYIGPLNKQYVSIEERDNEPKQK